MTGLLRSRPTSWKIFLPHNSLIICFVIPEPARYMFSALLLSHKSKDLLFLMAPDFFSSTCNCRSGGYRTISILPLPAFLSSSFFPTARDFFPSFCPLCLLGICVFLHLIRIYHAFSNLHRSFSPFPSAFSFSLLIPSLCPIYSCQGTRVGRTLGQIPCQDTGGSSN